MLSRILFLCGLSFLVSSPSAIDLNISMVDVEEGTSYIEYYNTKEKMFLDTGVLTGKRVRVFVNNIPTNVTWAVYITPNLNKEWVGLGMFTYPTTNGVFFDLPLRATNFFFKVNYKFVNFPTNVIDNSYPF